ncbi:ATP-binding protein [Streptomyces sp. NPDC001744]|uniref:ATP-binding protein n=1 Tax=Streptomyces sp. NPDC001744 TaxID=3364606 RepID=UPI0036CFAC0F
MISEPSRYYAVELHALPQRIGQVRRIVSAHLRHWHLDALVDHALLGVTELLTNVHRHARPDKRCTVEIELLLDRLTVSVRDHDPRLPEAGGPVSGASPFPGGAGGSVAAVPPADELATSGRGLALVGAVSESWGVRPCGDDGKDGKVVWFTLAAPLPGGPVRTREEAVYGAATEGPFTGYERIPAVPLGTPADPVPSPAPAVASAHPVLAGRAG